jgi:hypothetical protein
MAAQTREQDRYLGGRPPYGYRLVDAGPDPNRPHAAWGRRAHRLEPDPATAPVVRWMSVQRLAGHSVARITRALNDAGVPCPSAADPDGTRTERARHGRFAPWRRSWPIPGTPGGRCGTGSAPTSTWPTRPTPRWGISRCSGGTCPRAGSSPSIPRIRRWSARPTSSPPRRWPCREAQPGRRPGGTCWPGCSPAAGAGAGWNQPGPTASPPTGAATATPAPPAPDPAGEEHLRPPGPDPAASGCHSHPAGRRQPGPGQQHRPRPKAGPG